MLTIDKAVQTNEEDILDRMDSESESSVSSISSLDLNEKEYEELSTMIHELMEEYMKDHILKMSKPNFMTELLDDILHIIFQQLTDAGVFKDSCYDRLHDLVSETCNEWFLCQYNVTCPMRHLPHTTKNIIVTEFNQEEEFAIQYNTDILYEICQKDDANPEQRTPEWYVRRHNMLTASNIWQALNTDAQRNRLIYEKCKELECHTENKWISKEGSLHWGVKYEPLTVLVYEHMTGAKIGLFGCIQHSKYPFLGASPDGIVINRESPLYGRIVEIKNIYNREMNGIPSEAYWIQTQIQMQCCNLDACDFVETRFKEYETQEEFLHHIEFESEKMYGVILEFILRDSTTNIPVYKYSPISISNTELQEWINQTVNIEISAEYILFKTHYWYLDEIAMTTILKNDDWFRAAMPIIEDVWNTIQLERIEGFQHRAPKKRVPKNVIVIDDDQPKIPQSICLIKLP